MELLQNVKENPKITVGLILTVLTYIYDLLTVNSEILGIDAKTLTIIMLVINVISFVWDKFVNQEQSVFGVLKDHVGTRPKNPPRD